MLSKKTSSGKQGRLVRLLCEAVGILSAARGWSDKCSPHQITELRELPLWSFLMLHSHTRLMSERLCDKSEVAEIFSTPWRVARRSFNLEHQQNTRWRLESATIWKKMETERLFYISVLLCLFCICQVSTLNACLEWTPCRLYDTID